MCCVLPVVSQDIICWFIELKLVRAIHYLLDHELIICVGAVLIDTLVANCLDIACVYCS